MYDILKKQSWVKNNRANDLDLVVFDYPSVKKGALHVGYFGHGIIFLILSMSTPGFIVDMFFDEIDACDMVQVQLK